MTNVAILAVADGALFELGCAVELFGLHRPEFENWYRCQVVTFDDGALGYTSGISLNAKRISNLRQFDMLVVPSWNPVQAPQDKQMVNALLKFHQAGKRIISFCSGAFLLGYLGILDNREATTHWRYANRFKQLFPNTSYLDDVLYVYDGRIGCSAGSAAGLDLGIEVIREDFGYQLANQVARRLVLAAHRDGGQSQFVETPVLKSPAKFSQALDWGINNLPTIANVQSMADKARMSRRSFDRKFRAAFGMSANDWLIEQRLLLAKSLLEDSAESMDRVSEASGFGSTITMRYHFKRKFGISPQQFRRQFHRH